ncbi:hypothetical protein EBX31_14005, partial [bacterium]|nr:hypothetical protein [bacterium]
YQPERIQIGRVSKAAHTVDQLFVFIDEAHYFKNLETPTKMDRVAGIQTGGSERAFDMYMKARYLSEQNPGHGVTFATGTFIGFIIF